MNAHSKAKTAKTDSSRRWLNRQHSDPYVLKAKQEGYRSRAAYKLLELSEKDNLFKRGMNIVDLGAAPGGWSQIAKKLVGPSGSVTALDILPIESITGVDIIEGDFREPAVLGRLEDSLKGKEINLVISDMAPNITGIAAIDCARASELAEMAFEFAETVLVKKGVFLVKVFQGKEFDTYMARLKKHFEQVVVRKPKASRVESREVYLVAKGFIPGLSI